MFSSSHIVLANPFKTLLRSEEDFDILAFSHNFTKKVSIPYNGNVVFLWSKMLAFKEIIYPFLFPHFYKEYVESFQVFLGFMGNNHDFLLLLFSLDVLKWYIT